MARFEIDQTESSTSEREDVKRVVVRDWAYFSTRRKAINRDRSTLYEDFIRIIPEGKAAEFPIPGNVKKESARTALLTAAKRMNVQIQTTEVGMADGVLLVGRPPKSAREAVEAVAKAVSAA